MTLVYNIPEQLPVSFGTANAATTIGAGSYDGQAYYQIGGATELYRISIWIWDGTLSSWGCMPIGGLQGTGNPNSVYTPDSVNQDFLDTATGFLYRATGVTNNDWTRVN